MFYVFYLVWLPFDILPVVCYIISRLTDFTYRPICNPLQELLRGGNSHIHKAFPGNSESTHLSRDDHRREIG